MTSNDKRSSSVHPGGLMLLVLASWAGAFGVTATADPIIPADRETGQSAPVSYRHNRLDNRTAYIPPQCYTETEDAQGDVHNPCYVCHTASLRPNFVNDLDLQLNYAFAEDARQNPWKNLFRDRSAAMASISDALMSRYVATSNYLDPDGRTRLTARLAKVPTEWDYNANGRWDGVVPDAYFRFDDRGFDHDPSGRPTGWRAYAYYPFPGTFWPTNGSAGDVLIRLPAPFRNDADGTYDQTVYEVNLAVLEALMRERDVPIDPVDEAALGGVDLDRDGRIGTAERVVYDWAPVQERFMWFVGEANALQKAGEIKAAAGLFPVGTEFLHSVRYLSVVGDDVEMAPRMKELRYARKRNWLNYGSLKAVVDREFKEKRDFPNRLKTVLGNPESGVSNNQGWVYAGFIEDAHGELRPQTFEELAFCVGCHGGTGAARDGIFSFERKLGAQGYRHGWYHWSQKSMKGLPDPLRSDGRREYAYYLEQNHAGDEFRANSEVTEKFFDQGRLRKDMVVRLQTDVTELLWPSPARAVALNKAYKVIVDEQSFVYGRDALLSPPVNVHRSLQADQPTGIEVPGFAARLGYGGTSTVAGSAR